MKKKKKKLPRWVRIIKLYLDSFLMLLAPPGQKKWH
jgi:hypothetical protein